VSFRFPSRLIRSGTWLVVALALLWPASALAQETPPTLETLTIELWPEFDRPGILVIYKGVLVPSDSGAEEPVEVSLLLPPGAELLVTAFADPTQGGAPVETERETQTVGDRTQVILPAPADNFWLEFYAPPELITHEDDIHSFSYTWGGDLAVEQIIWNVQQPATATALTVEPTGGQMGTDNLGLPLYSVQVGAVAAGETASASVSYEKADDALSIDQVQPAQPAAIPEQPAGSTPVLAPSQRNPLLPIALAVLGVALLAGGMFVYSRSGREPIGGPDPSAPVQSAPRQRSTRAQRAAQQQQAAAGFCTNCGNPLLPNDKFCRECGTPVR
jgi:hypothetical protein